MPGLCKTLAQALTSRGFVVLLVCWLLLWSVQRPGRIPGHGREGFSREQRHAQRNAEMALATSERSRALLAQLKDAVVRLHPEKLSRLDFREGDTTRIDDKRVVFLCLRDPDTGEYYTWNDLIYVTLHECAHAISVGYDPQHTSIEFQTNFWDLLRKGEDAGIYKPDKPFVHEYCSMPTNPKDPGLVMR